MTATPEHNTDPIAALDFTPGCDAGDTTCGSDAGWIITWRTPTGHCCPTVQLVCNEHFRVIRNAVFKNSYLVCEHGRPVGRIRTILAHVESL